MLPEPPLAEVRIEKLKLVVPVYGANADEVVKFVVGVVIEIEASAGTVRLNVEVPVVCAFTKHAGAAIRKITRDTRLIRLM